jgi:hypothetical protein
MIKTKDVTVKVAQELDDVLVLVKDAVLMVKQGGDITSLVPELIKAIDGVAEVPASFTEALPIAVSTVSLRVAEIAAALLAPKIVPAVQKV